MEMTFGGRYVIMMMALFSIYTGLIYNEFFSVPFELCGPSAYECPDPSCRSNKHLRKLLCHLFSSQLFVLLTLTFFLFQGCFYSGLD